MPIPLPTDIAALAGLALVLTAAVVRLLNIPANAVRSGKAKWTFIVCLFCIWIPVGVGNLSLLAYVRGVVSDPSVTLVALALLSLWQRFFSGGDIDACEKFVLNLSIVVVAAVLYSTALGWGDWDAYRAGWGSSGMWLALLALCSIFWMFGFRLLPLLLGLAMLGWAVGWLESTNLWDYLIDPWLAVAALFQLLIVAADRVRSCLKRATNDGHSFLQ